MRAPRSRSIFSVLAFTTLALSACRSERAALHVVVSDSPLALGSDLLRVTVLDLDGAELAREELGKDEFRLPARLNFVVDKSSTLTRPNQELLVRAEAFAAGALLAAKEERVQLIANDVAVLFVKLAAPSRPTDDGGMQQRPVDDGGMRFPEGPPPPPPDGGQPPVPAQPAQLSLKTGPSAVPAGTCSAPFTVEIQDGAGVRATAQELTKLEIAAPVSSGLGLFSDATCQTALADVSIAAGASEASFYVSRRTAGDLSIEVKAQSLRAVTAAFSVIASAPKRANFSSAPLTAQAGACLGPIAFELFDAYDNRVRAVQPIALAVSGSPGLEIFSDACKTLTTVATLPAGSDKGQLFIRALTGGSAMLSLGTDGVQTAMQTVNVVPVIRKGACTLGEKMNTVVCPISPAQVDVTKTMLFFQSSATGSAVAETAVRCRLTSVNAITCDRGGTQTVAEVNWQTAELGSGIKVQHLDTSCAGKTLEIVPLQSVNPANTFLLFSQYASDLDYTADNFVTAELVSTTAVELRATKPCQANQHGALQVVEMADITVTRGATTAMTGLALPVPNLPAVNPASTALLFTYRTPTESTKMCDRMVRGEMTSPTSLNFTRANGNNCTAYPIDVIAWERIDFGARATSQQVLSNMADGVLTSTVPITPVDLSRSLVFAGNQTQSGQSSGESNLATNDRLGAMAGFHTLLTPDSLEIRRVVGLGATKWTSFVLQLQP